MAKGLSKQQKESLSILYDSNGCMYHNEFLPKLKAKLFPDLWWLRRIDNNCFGSEYHYDTEFIDYGKYRLHRNSARVTIAKIVNRLIKRELIELKKTGSEWYTLSVFLTIKGRILVNEVKLVDNGNQYEEAVIIEDNG